MGVLSEGFESKGDISPEIGELALDLFLQLAGRIPDVELVGDLVPVVAVAPAGGEELLDKVGVDREGRAGPGAGVPSSEARTQAPRV